MAGVTHTGTILDRIMAHKADEIEVAKQRRPLSEIQAMLNDVPPALDFLRALQQKETVALIAEVKKASPSKGIFLEDFDPVAIAQMYAENGATAISVLTDEAFFQGHLDYLRTVRQAVTIPLLRKEFILDTYQVFEARAAGADAVLLIMACLDDALFQELYTCVNDLGMTALIEVHNEVEMQRVLPLAPPLIGVNNRDLKTFTVDLETTARLAAVCPETTTLVSESGIHSPNDVSAVARAGASAILVGESLILADDRPAKIQALGSIKKQL